MHTDKKIQMHTDVVARHEVPKQSQRLQRLSLGKISVIVFKIAVINILIMLGNSINAYCLNVSPGRIEVSVAPSKSYEDVLMIKNAEKRELEVKLRIEDWFKINAKKIDTFEWLRLSPLEFGLKEGEMREVRFKVVVPKKAKGELNGMIFIEAKPKEISEGAIGINTSIGVPIYVMVKGTEKFKAKVENLKVMSASPLELALTIENSGNVHIRPTGVIEIIDTDKHGFLTDRHGLKNMDLRGFTVPLNEYNYPVLPKSSRTLEIRSDNRLESGKYVADVKMGYGNKKYRRKIVLKI